jgi:hypothetical protein
MNTSLFRNRKLIIAAKHSKEQVIAPLLEKAFGINCFVNKNFDTDTLGTFTGEIEREHDPISTLRKKCLMAMELSNCDLGVASEGSFGPHPSMFFVSANDEFLIFIDKKNELEVIVRELSTETNFNGREIASKKDLIDFSNTINFPSHGIILRKSKNDTKHIIKNISSTDELKKAFNLLYKKFKSVYAETDMRAMFNPSRMAVIETTARKLVDTLNYSCPQCNIPGFAVKEVKRGLKCKLCSSPTNSTLSFIYSCQKCQFKKEALYPHKKTSEDPMHCDFCNP